MKKFVIAILLAMPLIMQAQTVLTPEQQLEKAKQEAQAAKEAVKEAKKAAKRAAAEAKKAAKDKAKQAEKARIEAEIERANKEAARYKMEAERIRKEARQTVEDAQKAVAGSSSGWSIPDNSANESNQRSSSQQQSVSSKVTMPKTDKYDSKYLEGGVPQDADGKVVFTLDFKAPGKTAKQIYDITYQYLDELTKGENQIKSHIALVNQEQNIIAARYTEWLEFSKSFLSLDRTEFDYTLIAKCTDNHLELTMSRIHYDYEKGRPTHMSVSADEWITDEVAINKKKNRLRPLSSKFRRNTIDRKDEIFSQISYRLR